MRQTPIAVKDLNPIIEAISNYVKKLTGKQLLTLYPVINDIMTNAQKPMAYLRVDQPKINEFKRLAKNMFASKEMQHEIKQIKNDKLKKELLNLTKDFDEFIAIPKVWQFNPDKLTDHQKEKLKERNRDIPALYNDISQSQDSVSIHEWVPKSTSTLKNDQPEDIAMVAVAIPSNQNNLSDTENMENVILAANVSSTTPKVRSELKRIQIDMNDSDVFFSEKPRLRRRPDKINKPINDTKKMTTKKTKSTPAPQDNPVRNYAAGEEENHNDLLNESCDVIQPSQQHTPTANQSRRSLKFENHKKISINETTISSNNEQGGHQPNTTNLLAGLKSSDSDPCPLNVSMDKLDVYSQDTICLDSEIANKFKNAQQSETENETQWKSIQNLPNLKETDSIVLESQEILDEDKDQTETLLMNSEIAEILDSSIDKSESETQDDRLKIIDGDTIPMSSEETITESEIETEIINENECIEIYDDKENCENLETTNINGMIGMQLEITGAKQEVEESNLTVEAIENKNELLVVEITTTTDEFVDKTAFENSSEAGPIEKDVNLLQDDNSHQESKVYENEDKIDNLKNKVLDGQNGLQNINENISETSIEEMDVDFPFNKSDGDLAIVSSPNFDDAEQRNADLLNNTADISPILEKSSSSSNDSFDQNGDQAEMKKINSPPNNSDVTKTLPELNPKMIFESPRTYRVLNSTPKTSSASIPSCASPNLSRNMFTGRGAQLLNLVNKDVINSPKSCNRIKLDNGHDERKISPVNQCFDTPTSSNKDLLTFSKVVPLPSASPAAAILKRKHADVSNESDHDTPLNKRKRVSFRDPPISETKEFIAHSDEYPSRSLAMEQDENSASVSPLAKNVLKRKSRVDSIVEIAKLSKLSTPPLINSNKENQELSLIQDEKLKTTKEINLIGLNFNGSDVDQPEDDVISVTPSPMLTFNTKEAVLRFIMEEYTPKQLLETYLENEQNSTKNLTKELTHFFNENHEIRTDCLDQLSEKYSKEFLDHAIRENLGTQVCERLSIEPILDYVGNQSKIDDTVEQKIRQKLADCLQKIYDSDLRRQIESTETKNYCARIAPDKALEYICKEAQRNVQFKQTVLDAIFVLFENGTETENNDENIKLNEIFHKNLLKIFSKNMSYEQIFDYLNVICRNKSK